MPHATLTRALAPSLLVALVAGVACHSSSGKGGSSSPTGVVARFDLTTNPTPNFLDVPFPSDIYLQNGQVMTIPGVDAIVTQNSQFITHELAKMDGFSRTALAMFYVDDYSAPVDENDNVGSAMLDPTTFPADEAACVADTSSMFLIDLDATDKAKSRVLCRAMVHQDYINPQSRELAVVGPARGVVLDEAHHYAAVLTSRVKHTDGRTLVASPDFQAVASGAASAPAVYTAAYAKVAADLSGALASDGAQIIAIAPYTTNAMSKALYALRDTLEKAPAPALKFDAPSMAPMQPSFFGQPVNGQLPAGFTASLDDWLGVVDPTAKLPDGSDDPDATLKVRAHDKIAVVGTGVFAAQNYLQHYQGTSYGALDQATFATDASGNIIPAPDAPTDSIWVSFAVPAAPMPTGGYPTVIYQHGLDGSREDFLEIANTLCNAGWMVAAIDSITFGARAPEGQWQVDKANDFAAAPGAKYAGPDGFGDANSKGAHNGSTDLFGVLLDLGAVRDQFRQAAIDTTQLVKVLRSSPDLSALAWNGVTPKIDPGSVAYLGMSLGSIQGAAAAALEPGVKNWVLNVAGGGLILELATHGPVIANNLNEAAGFNFAFLEASLDESHPLVNLVQAVVEPGDPLSLVGNLVLHPQPLLGQPTQPRNVLQFEVIYDELVPNEADEALARAGGWGLAQPNVGSNAGILDFKNFANDLQRLPLPSVAPQSDGSFHDTPQAGTTAIVVQESPATHGDNMISSTGQRQYCIPYANFPTGTPFNVLDTDKWFSVKNPYRQTQATLVGFLKDGFAGKVPAVVVDPAAAPVRDLDGDTYTDDIDAAPCDPNVH
jgi:dienelactone hydrolase